MTDHSPLAHKNYRSFLKDELGRRQSRNPRYSLRSFARDLGLSPPRLSDVLRGRYGISSAAASALAGKLQLNEDETSFFCDLAEAEHGRSRFMRENASARLSRRAAGKGSFCLVWSSTRSADELAKELEALLKEHGLRESRLEITARPLG